MQRSICPHVLRISRLDLRSSCIILPTSNVRSTIQLQIRSRSHVADKSRSKKGISKGGIAKPSNAYQSPRPTGPPQTPEELAKSIDLDPSKRSPFPFFWTLAGISFFGSITYVIVLFTRVPPENATDLDFRASIPEDVSDRYHKTATGFDSDVGFFESVSGLNLLRRTLMRKASGHVLEVSAGTGRNLSFVNWKKVKSMTMLDQAEEMTRVSREKAEKEWKAGRLPQMGGHPGASGGDDAKGKSRVRFMTQSALDPIPAEEVPEGGFDTVVQTMGVCSTGDPVGLLKRMAGLVNPDGGTILLLEHGRGKYEWLNRALDRWAPRHADRHGCWWNRDVGEIVKESGLEVVRVSRWHLGTTWWLEARVKKEGETGQKDDRPEWEKRLG